MVLATAQQLMPVCLVEQKLFRDYGRDEICNFVLSATGVVVFYCRLDDVGVRRNGHYLGSIMYPCDVDERS